MGILWELLHPHDPRFSADPASRWASGKAAQPGHHAPTLLDGTDRAVQAASAFWSKREMLGRGPDTAPISVLGQLCAQQISGVRSLILPKSGMK